MTIDQLHSPETAFSGTWPELDTRQPWHRPDAWRLTLGDDDSPITDTGVECSQRARQCMNWEVAAALNLSWLTPGSITVWAGTGGLLHWRGLSTFRPSHQPPPPIATRCPPPDAKTEWQPRYQGRPWRPFVLAARRRTQQGTTLPLDLECGLSAGLLSLKHETSKDEAGSRHAPRIRIWVHDSTGGIHGIAFSLVHSACDIRPRTSHRP